MAATAPITKQQLADAWRKKFPQYTKDWVDDETLVQGILNKHPSYAEMLVPSYHGIDPSQIERVPAQPVVPQEPDSLAVATAANQSVNDPAAALKAALAASEQESLLGTFGQPQPKAAIDTTPQDSFLDMAGEVVGDIGNFAGAFVAEGSPDLDPRVELESRRAELDPLVKKRKAHLDKMQTLDPNSSAFRVQQAAAQKIMDQEQEIRNRPLTLDERIKWQRQEVKRVSETGIDESAGGRLLEVAGSVAGKAEAALTMVKDWGNKVDQLGKAQQQGYNISVTPGFGLAVDSRVEIQPRDLESKSGKVESFLRELKEDGQAAHQQTFEEILELGGAPAGAAFNMGTAMWETATTLMLAKAATGALPGGMTGPGKTAADTIRHATKFAAWRFITTEGTEQERMAAAQLAFAYSATPAIASGMPTDKLAFLVDWGLNNGITFATGQYGDALAQAQFLAKEGEDGRDWETLDDATKAKYLAVTVPTIAVSDLLFSLSTKSRSDRGAAELYRQMLQSAEIARADEVNSAEYRVFEESRYSDSDAAPPVRIPPKVSERGPEAQPITDAPPKRVERQVKGRAQQIERQQAERPSVPETEFGDVNSPEAFRYLQKQLGISADEVAKIRKADRQAMLDDPDRLQAEAVRRLADQRGVEPGDTEKEAVLEFQRTAEQIEKPAESVDLFHVGVDLKPGQKMTPDDRGLVWFSTTDAYGAGSEGVPTTRIPIPRDKLLVIESADGRSGDPEGRAIVAATENGSKAEVFEEAERRGYLAVQRSKDVSMRPETAERLLAEQAEKPAEQPKPQAEPVKAVEKPISEPEKPAEARVPKTFNTIKALRDQHGDVPRGQIAGKRGKWKLKKGYVPKEAEAVADREVSIDRVKELRDEAQARIDEAVKDSPQEIRDAVAAKPKPELKPKRVPTYFKTMKKLREEHGNVKPYQIKKTKRGYKLNMTAEDPKAAEKGKIKKGEIVRARKSPKARKEFDAEVLQVVDDHTFMVRIKGESDVRTVDIDQLRKRGGVETRAAQEAELAQMTPKEKQRVRDDAREFDDIITKQAAFYDFRADETGQRADASREKDSARDEAARVLGAEPNTDMSSILSRAKLLPALKEWVAKDAEAATREVIEDDAGREIDAQKIGSDKDINEADLVEDTDRGSLVYKDGEWMITKPSEEGVKELVDGKTIVLDDFDSIEAKTAVDPGDPGYEKAYAEYREQEAARKGSPTKPVTATQQDLIKEPVDLSLRGEEADDGARIQGEKDASEEARIQADKDQGKLFEDKPKGAAAPDSTYKIAEDAPPDSTKVPSLSDRKDAPTARDYEAEAAEKLAAGYIEGPSNSRVQKVAQYLRRGFSRTRGLGPELYTKAMERKDRMSAAAIVGKADGKQIQRIRKTLGRKFSREQVNNDIARVLRGSTPETFKTVKALRAKHGDVKNSEIVRRPGGYALKNAPPPLTPKAFGEKYPSKDTPQFVEILTVMKADIARRGNQLADLLEKAGVPDGLVNAVRTNIDYLTRLYEIHLLGEDYQPRPEDRLAAELEIEAAQLEVLDKLAQDITKAQTGAGIDVLKYLQTGDTSMLKGLPEDKQAAIKGLGTAYFDNKTLIDRATWEGDEVSILAKADALRDASQAMVDMLLERHTRKAGEPGSIDVSNLHERHLEGALRLLYGEVTDPAILVRKTAEVQEKLVSNLVFFETLFREGQGKWWDTKPSREKGLTERMPSGETAQYKYGNLAGPNRFVSKDLKVFLDGPKPVGKGRQAYFMTKGMQRLLKLYGPRTINRNFVQSVLSFAMGNGDLYRKTYGKNFDQSMKLTISALAGKPDSLKEIAELAKLGIVGEQTSSLADDVNRLTSAFGKGQIRGLIQKLGRIYAYIDYPAKIASYWTRLDEGDTPKQAAEHVRKFYQNPDSLPNFARDLSKFPVADYPSYWFDSTRILGNQVMNAARAGQEGDWKPALGFLTSQALLIGTYAFAGKEIAKITKAGIEKLQGKERDVEEYTNFTTNETLSLRKFMPSYYATAPMSAWWETRSDGRKEMFYAITGNQGSFPVEDLLVGAMQSSGGSPFKFAAEAGKELVRQRLSPGMFEESVSKFLTGDELPAFFQQNRYQTKGLLELGTIDPEATAIFKESAIDLGLDFIPLGGKVKNIRQIIEREKREAIRPGRFTARSELSDVYASATEPVRVYRVTEEDFVRKLETSFRPLVKALSETKKAISRQPEQEDSFNAKRVDYLMQMNGIYETAKELTPGWVDESTIRIILGSAGGAGLSEDEQNAIILGSAYDVFPYSSRGEQTYKELFLNQLRQKSEK